MSNSIVHFEIHATDPERSIAFYQSVFGWEFPKWMEESPYWGIVTVPKHAIPGMAWQGYYKDPDGNIFGVHEPDEKAK